jgi:hypothetical protein
MIELRSCHEDDNNNDDEVCFVLCSVKSRLPSAEEESAQGTSRVHASRTMTPFEATVLSVLTQWQIDHDNEDQEDQEEEERGRTSSQNDNIFMHGIEAKTYPRQHSRQGLVWLVRTGMPDKCVLCVVVVARNSLWRHWGPYLKLLASILLQVVTHTRDMEALIEQQQSRIAPYPVYPHVVIPDVPSLSSSLDDLHAHQSHPPFLHSYPHAMGSPHMSSIMHLMRLKSLVEAVSDEIGVAEVLKALYIYIHAHAEMIVYGT